MKVSDRSSFITVCMDIFDFFMTAFERFKFLFKDGLKTLRNVHANDHENSQER
jgi:hypothetical protein